MPTPLDIALEKDGGRTISLRDIDAIDKALSLGTDGPETLPDRTTPERTTEVGSRNKGKADEGSNGTTPLAATPAERQSARDLLTKIGVEFAENRQKSKSKAFETYQRAIAVNLGTLVMGGAITMKEGTVLLMDLEAFMKSSVREGETAATRLQKFLAGDLDNEVD